MPVCNQSARYSNRISGKVAPILLIRMKPLMPNVEGNSHEKYFQNGGTAAPGHEMPLMKSNGKDVKTNISMQVSRLRMAMEAVMAKKMHADK